MPWSRLASRTRLVAQGACSEAAVSLRRPPACVLVVIRSGQCMHGFDCVRTARQRDLPARGVPPACSLSSLVRKQADERASDTRTVWPRWIPAAGGASHDRGYGQRSSPRGSKRDASLKRLRRGPVGHLRNRCLAVSNSKCTDEDTGASVEPDVRLPSG